jgi:hypothetical protein
MLYFGAGGTDPSVSPYRKSFRDVTADTNEYQNLNPDSPGNDGLGEHRYSGWR